MVGVVGCREYDTRIGEDTRGERQDRPPQPVSLAFLEEALKIAQDVVAADRATEAGDEAALERLSGPKRGALTQIVEQNTPPGLHNIIPAIVDRIDAIAVEVAYTGWTQSDAGDKRVRRELRTALKEYGLPIKGDLFDRTYEYVRENY